VHCVGTHAIAAALRASLRPGDELLSVGGAPYDTLEEVIGTRGDPGAGSLADWGVTFRIHPLRQDGLLDIKSLAAAINPGVLKCIFPALERLLHQLGLVWEGKEEIPEL
jgi:cystathionine beta-lyase family protein involved in aluminum resistance